MTEKRCGTCAMYAPTINPATGRPRTSDPGTCGWRPPAWPIVAESYNRVQWGMRRMEPDWPTPKLMYSASGTNCAVWAPKKKPRQVSTQAQLIDGG